MSSEENNALFTLVSNLQKQVLQLQQKTNEIDQNNASFKQVIVQNGKIKGDPLYADFPTQIPKEALPWIGKNPATEALTSKERKDIIRQYMEVKDLKHLSDENGMVQQLVKDKTKQAFITKDLVNAARDNLAISRMAISTLAFIDSNRGTEINPRKLCMDMLRISLNNVHRISKSQRRMALEASGMQRIGKFTKAHELGTNCSIICNEHIEDATKCNNLLTSFYKTRPRQPYSPGRRGGRGRGKRGRYPA